jgi:hypothetical protein
MDQINDWALSINEGKKGTRRQSGTDSVGG